MVPLFPLENLNYVIQDRETEKVSLDLQKKKAKDKEKGTIWMA